MSSDTRRDRVNLARILARIENNDISISPPVRAQNIQYARTLAKRIYGSEHNPYESRLDGVENRLDTASIASSYRRKTPFIRSFTSLIEPVAAQSEVISPLPSDPSAPTTSSNEEAANLVEQMLIPTEDISQHFSLIPVPTQPPIDLSALLAPTPQPPSTPTLISSSSSQPRLNTESTTTFITTSRQTQEDITGRMAEMAAQLKRNAQFFGKALEDDKEAVMQTEEILEKNMTTMQKERGRLGNYSGKSRGTTWLVFLSVAVVGIAWVLMFFLIRITNMV